MSKLQCPTVTTYVCNLISTSYNTCKLPRNSLSLTKSIHFLFLNIYKTTCHPETCLNYLRYCIRHFIFRLKHIITMQLECQHCRPYCANQGWNTQRIYSMYVFTTIPLQLPSVCIRPAVTPTMQTAQPKRINSGPLLVHAISKHIYSLCYKCSIYSHQLHCCICRNKHLCVAFLVVCGWRDTVKVIPSRHKIKMDYHFFFIFSAFVSLNEWMLWCLWGWN